MNLDFSQDHFALFGLARDFGLDPAALDAAYRKLQAQVHPDRFAAGMPSEQRLAMQWAARVNEAYQTLKHPVARARYLLNLQGYDTQEETNTAMPAEFLIRQMEWREAVANARARADADALAGLACELEHLTQTGLTDLAHALNGQFSPERAIGLVRQLRFLDKLDQELADAEEAVTAA